LLARARLWRPFGLRLRLTIGHLVFFSLLLAGLGVFFRQTLASIFEANLRSVLEEEWETLITYLHVDSDHAAFSYEPSDQEENYIVSRLRRVSLLADANGRVLDVSTAYRNLGLESAAEIRSIVAGGRPLHRTRFDERGVPYLVYYRVHRARDRTFLVAMGRSMEQNTRVLADFTTRYFAFLPLMILGSGLLGWVLAGRALQPLNEVAGAAQKMSGSNLRPRIAVRGAGDELDRFIQAFNEMIDRLDSSFNQIRRFSTDVSHELRTPLTAIRGQLEVALFTARTAEQYREAIGNAMEDVERLSQIVRALLLLSQSESGQVALQREPVEMAGLVAGVVDQFQIPAEVGRVTLEADLPGPAWTNGDRLQLERLVSNLLSNAVKYTPPGGWVRVRLGSGEAGVTLAVEDTGRGIPAEHLPHIYDRFYRVPDGAPDPDKGLGLGLSFVSWIVKAHGGQIEVASAAGEGTRFAITLPAGAPPATPAGAADRIAAAQSA
jgi:heavy metal sensor kinase